MTFVPFIKHLRHFRQTCKFIAAPDVVANAIETIKRFRWWSKSIRGIGFPVALVLQDGMEPHTIPWHLCDAVFVGGSTEWKLSQHAIHILNTARKLGKWRHVGRVNSHIRMRHFWGFADSFDGTGFARAPDQKIKSFLPEMLWLERQIKLPMEV